MIFDQMNLLWIGMPVERRAGLMNSQGRRVLPKREIEVLMGVALPSSHHRKERVKCRGVLFAMVHNEQENVQRKKS